VAANTEDLLPSGAGLAASVAVESNGELGELGEIKARGYWEQVWLRLRRDKVAIVGGIFIGVLILIAFVGAPVAESRLGHGPNDVNTAGGLDPNSQLPVGPWTTVTTEPYPGAPGEWKDTLYVLGADSQLGRDMFLRLLYGAQTSLEVATLSFPG
jgi:peptide/nickel transport system permease protein